MVSDAGVGDARIVRALSEMRTAHGIPAMAAAYLTSQGLREMGVVGTRKQGTDVPVTLNDKWHLGSNTKMMTATLIASLVEREKLSWNTTMAEAFPGISEDLHVDLRGVTILHVLSHRAGLPENLDYDRFDVRKPVRDQRLQAVRAALRNKPFSIPGSHFLYSNLGYIIAGAITEQVTGVEWEEAMARHVFTPLSMTSAGFGGMGTPGEIDQPWGHEIMDTPCAANGPEADNPPLTGPAGRVHCSMQDWARFIGDQLRGARGAPGLLSAGSYRMLHTPPFGGGYALGWGVNDIEWAGGRALAHAGCNTMHYAVAIVVPDKDYGVLVCANAGIDAAKAVDGVIRIMVRDILGS
jgi:CubicO group peptidase (beta-lactamase class C family)